LLAPNCEIQYLIGSGNGGSAQAIEELTLYPNPNDGNDRLFVIAPFLTSGMAEVEIYSITGMLSQRIISTSGKRITLDTTGFATGIYMISVTDAKTGEVRQARYVHVDKN
jgi:hypothetical protein